MPCRQFNYIKVRNNNLYLEIILTRGEAHNRAAITDFLSRHFGAPANYHLYFKDQQGHYRQINPGSPLRQAFASARAFLGGPRYVCLEVWAQCYSKQSIKTEIKSEKFCFQ